jgi:hypothetical protein
MSRRGATMAVALSSALVLSMAVANAALAAFTRSAATVAQAVSSRNLVAPASITATASGHNVSVAWPAGSNGSGYQLLAAANGTSSTCPGTGLSLLTSTTLLAHTDSGRFAPQGAYECYQVRTTYGTWSSITGNPTAAAQLGFVASSVAVVKGGMAGRIDTGDQIVVTYNQPVNTASGPAATENVCASSASDLIVIGSTGTGANCTASPVSLGTITGETVSKDIRFATTWSWNAAKTVLTITLGATTAGNNSKVSGTGTFNPTTTATSMLSATGAFHNCDTNAGGGNCLPLVGGAF